MATFTLPKNSKITKGRTFKAEGPRDQVKSFKVYRYDPEVDANPRWDVFEVSADDHGPMLATAEDADALRPIPQAVHAAGLRPVNASKMPFQMPWRLQRLKRL